MSDASDHAGFVPEAPPARYKSVCTNILPQDAIMIEVNYEDQHHLVDIIIV